MTARILLMLLATLVGSQSTAVPPVTSTGKSFWQVDYSPKNCKLIRARAGRPELIFVVRPYATTVELWVFLDKDSRTKSGLATLTAGQLHGDSKFYWTVFLKDRSTRALRMALTRDELTEVAKARKASITGADGLNLHLELPSFGSAIAALNPCEADLVRHLGIAQTWVTPPKETPELRTLFRHTDYPADLLKRNATGTVLALLKIDATGKVAECSGYETEGDAGFEALACNVLTKRAKFQPALDRNDKPVVSYVVSPPIRFSIEEF